MRFMCMHKTDESNEAGVLPSPELMAKMGALTEDGFKKGIILAGEGLRATSTGVRLNFAGGKRTVTPGPFTGHNELIAGFCIMRVKSLDEAIAWTTRFAEIIGDVEIDIRPVMEPWDLGVMPRPEGDTGTRYMAAHKADAHTEAGAPPTPDVVEKMTKLVEDMKAAGVFITSEGLQPSSKSTRLKFKGGQRTVIDGPFTESKELIAGYAILNSNSKEELIEWSTRFASIIGDVELDIRPMYDC